MHLKRTDKAMIHIGPQEIRPWKKEINAEGPEEEVQVIWRNRGGAEEKLTAQEQELWRMCAHVRKMELLGLARSLHKQT